MERVDTVVFIHDNGNIHVLSATRCGHTSMFKYFGFASSITGFTGGGQNPEDVPSRWYNWIESETRRILVLRNPIDRWKSAEVFTGFLKHLEPSNGMDKDTFMRVHREPFLIDIPRYIDIEIIPFENLSDYLPLARGTIVSNSNNIHRSVIEMTPTLREEYNQYRYFRKNCKVISPEEWKELTP